MKPSYYTFMDVTGETVMINPHQVRCIRSTGNPKESRIVFDKDHNVVVKSSLDRTMGALINAGDPNYVPPALAKPKLPDVEE